jgi:hypothetical protein
MATRDEAIGQLQLYAGLTAAEAGQVVEAVAVAAQEEAIDQIANDALVPASVADARVARIARICAHLGRLLSPTEVEVVLRVPPQTAQSTLNRLRAGYRGEVNGWMKQIVRDAKADIEDASTPASGNYWRIIFNDPIAISYAIELLRQQGMTRAIVADRAQQTLTVPEEMRDRQGNMRKSLEVLGLG